MVEQGQIDPMLNLLRSKLVKLSQSSDQPFAAVQQYMEDLLPKFTLNEQLWTLYVDFTQDICTD